MDLISLDSSCLSTFSSSSLSSSSNSSSNNSNSNNHSKYRTESLTMERESEDPLLDSIESGTQQPVTTLCKPILKRAKKVPIFLQKHMKQKKKELLRKKDYGYIPILFVPHDVCDIYADGDIILERDYLNDQYSNQKTINWSHWKSVIQIKDIIPMNIIEIHSCVNIEQKKDLSFMIQRYVNTPDQRIHDLGVALQTFTSHKDEYMKTMNVMLKSTPFLMESLFSLQYKYTLACLDWIKKNVDQNGYFFYAFGSFNKCLHQYEQNYFGYSKSLIDLLGFDDETFKNHVLRKGRFEFYNSMSRIEVIMSKITYGLEKWSELNRDVILLTIEEIPIYCKQRKIAISLSQFKSIIEEYNLSNYINEDWFPFLNLCGVTEFYIEPSQIANVLAKREQSRKEIPLQAYHEDLRYSVQSEILIERYYHDEFSKILKQQEVTNTENQQNQFTTIQSDTTLNLNSSQSLSISSQRQCSFKDLDEN